MSTKKPTHILTDTKCEELEDAARWFAIDNGEHDGLLYIQEWPEASGQFIWYRAEYDGELNMLGCGVAIPVKGI